MGCSGETGLGGQFVVVEFVLWFDTRPTAMHVERLRPVPRTGYDAGTLALDTPLTEILFEYLHCRLRSDNSVLPWYCTRPRRRKIIDEEQQNRSAGDLLPAYNGAMLLSPPCCP